MKEKDPVKIKQLNREILDMKQTKVKLIKEMRQESEKFRVWKLKREQELTKLKNQDQKKQQQIVKMEALHTLKVKVWKQKEAETNAKVKRLEAILSKRTDTQKQKCKERMEHFDSFILHESEMVVGTMEAKETLDSLIKDREQLMQQLGKLESEELVDNEQIELVKQDIKSRSTQISGLQHKLFNYDVGKYPSIFSCMSFSHSRSTKLKIYNNEEGTQSLKQNSKRFLIKISARMCKYFN